MKIFSLPLYINNLLSNKARLDIPSITWDDGEIIWEDIHGNKHEVPDVLTSGHHEKIDKWRKEKSLEKTKELRPDLFKKEI